MNAFFNGLAGMVMFSRGLDTISNNIANMNTPGFHGSDLFYQALSNGQGDSDGGARVTGKNIRFNPGDIRETGNAMDLAINGNGYFVLRTEDGLLYTRSGQFEFDDEGYLVDQSSGHRVAALDEFGNLSDINIDSMLSLNPEASTEVEFSGNLSTGDADHSINGLSVFNSLGEEIELNYQFTNNNAATPGSWLVEVTDENGTVVGNGEIRFGADGTPEAGFNQMQLSIPATSNGSANAILDVSLNFGEPGTFNGTTSFAGGSVSTLSASLVDGQGVEGLVAASFNADGELNLLYSNGDTETPFRLALAYFQDESNLSYSQGSIFRSNGSDATIGFANEGSNGAIVGESLEGSNVDLVREFADMIVVQRGYQASSRVMNIANQLIEQLYDNT